MFYLNFICASLISAINLFTNLFAQGEAALSRVSDGVACLHCTVPETVPHLSSDIPPSRPSIDYHKLSPLYYCTAINIIYSATHCYPFPVPQRPRDILRSSRWSDWSLSPHSLADQFLRCFNLRSIIEPLRNLINYMIYSSIACSIQYRSRHFAPISLLDSRCSWSSN